MEEIYAYHLTSKANIHSILLNGLVPDCGHNSRSVNECHLFTYFTTSSYINTWFERFNFDREDTIILKFPCRDFEKRYGYADDCFTTETILAENILVVGESELSLQDYYDANKDMLNVAENKMVADKIKSVVDRLEKIDGQNLEAERGWDYNEVDPDVIGTIDLLRNVRSLDNKKDYEEIVRKIKGLTLDKLINNNLGVTTDTELYKTIDFLFEDVMSENPKMTLFDVNCATVLAGTNLFFRLNDRWNRTGKRYNDDIKWRFDTFDFRNFPQDSLGELYDETKQLYKVGMKGNK